MAGPILQIVKTPMMKGVHAEAVPVIVYSSILHSTQSSFRMVCIAASHAIVLKPEGYRTVGYTKVVDVIKPGLAINQLYPSNAWPYAHCHSP